MLLRYLHLWKRFFSATTMANMAYKADFIAWSLVTVGWFIWNIAFYEILFLQVNQIAGWTKGQVIILQGFYFITEFIVYGLIYANVSELPLRIVNGGLDRDLIRPINLQFLLSFRNFNQNQLNSLLLGIGTVIYGYHLLNIPWSLVNIFFALIVLFIAAIFLYGAYFATVCVAFWFDRLTNIVYAFPELRDLSKVPHVAYSGLPKILFTYVVPITLITSLPSTFLFGKPDWLLLVWFSIVSVIVVKLSQLMLKLGLKHYSSASS